MAGRDKVLAEGFDESGFSHPRDTRNTQAHRLSGMWQQRLQQRFGVAAMVFARRFDQRDRLGQGPAVAGVHLFG